MSTKTTRRKLSCASPYQDSPIREIRKTDMAHASVDSSPTTARTVGTSTSCDREERPILKPFAPMVPQVEAIEQIRRMRGGAQSHLMRCSDGGYYVVKFQNNPQGLRVLCNELLGTQMAHLMNLPAPRVSLISVSPGLIRDTEELVMELPHGRKSCQPGLCFGSRHAGDVGPSLSPSVRAAYDLIPESELPLVDNRNAFAGMLVFDQWTCNLDSRQMVVVRNLKTYRFFAYMIDNGFCFGGTEWIFHDSPLQGVYRQFPVYDFIRSFDVFEPWLERVERIDMCSLAAIASRVPRQWVTGDSSSLEQLIYTLERRRKRVRELLWLCLKASPGAFRNFRGNPYTTCGALRRDTLTPAGPSMILSHKPIAKTQDRLRPDLHSEAIRCGRAGLRGTERNVRSL